MAWASDMDEGPLVRQLEAVRLARGWEYEIRSLGAHVAVRVLIPTGAILVLHLSLLEALRGAVDLVNRRARQEAVGA